MVAMASKNIRRLLAQVSFLILVFIMILFPSVVATSYNVSGSGGMFATSDFGVYGSYPNYTGARVNISTYTSNLTYLHNVTVNISTDVEVTFDLALNFTNGSEFRSSSEANTGTSFRFEDVNFSEAAILQFFMNLTEEYAAAGLFYFNVTVLNFDETVNLTYIPSAAIYIGAINITTLPGSVATSTSAAVSFNYFSEKDSDQLCSVVVDGVVTGTNSSTLNATETSLVTTISEGVRSVTVQCVDDQTPADNVTTSASFIYYIDTTAPNLSVDSPSNGSSIISDHLIIDATVTDSTNLTYSNATLNDRRALVNITNGSQSFNFTFVDGGKNTFVIYSRDIGSHTTNTSNITVFISKNESLTRRGGELKTAFGGDVIVESLVFRVGADTLSGNYSVNTTWNVTVQLNGTNATYVNVTIPFNGLLASWNFTLSPSLDSSNASTNSTAISLLTGGNVRTMVLFKNFGAFLPSSEYDSVSMFFNEPLGTNDVYYLENDSVSASSAHKLSLCSSNATPSSVTTASAACYTTDGAESFTAHIPHLSGVAVVSDSQGPRIAITSPASQGQLSDAIIPFFLYVNESNPASTFCTYYLTNDSGLSLIDNTSISFSSFTFLSNYSFNFSMNISSSSLNNMNSSNLTVNCTDTKGNGAAVSVNFSVSDTTVPQVFNVSESVSSTTATISWTTSELADYTFSHGTTTSLGTTSTDSTFDSTGHTRSLSSLSEGTTYYYNITGCDRAGNCNRTVSGDFTTTTTSSSGGSSGGGGGGGSSSAAASSAPTIYSQIWSSLNPDIPKTVLPGSTGIAVSEINFNVKEKVNNAKLTVSSLGLTRPSGVNAPSGLVLFQYVDIVTTNIENSNLDSVKIKFKVDTTWLKNNSIPDTQVYLLRYTGIVWTQLTTRKLFSSETSVTYEADTPGFSYFAVAGKKLATSPSDVLPPPAPSTTEETPVDLPEESDVGLPDGSEPQSPPGASELNMQAILWVVAIVLVIGLSVGFFIFSQKKIGKIKL